MVMNIKKFIDDAFASVEQTQKVQELKDELFANLTEKYTESIKQGKSDADAYTQTINSVGDISELVDSVKNERRLSDSQQSGGQMIFASLIACSVALFCISPFTILPFIGSGNILTGTFIMFVLIAVGVGLIIFAVLTRPKKYRRKDETIVEEFKERHFNSESRSRAYKSFSGAFWGLVVAVYLIVSFIFDAWAISWIIFIIAAAIYNAAKGFYQLKNRD